MAGRKKQFLIIMSVILFPIHLTANEIDLLLDRLVEKGIRIID